MPFFRYTPPDDIGASSFTIAYGLRFNSFGDPVQISPKLYAGDGKVHVLSKLRGNPHFEEVAVDGEFAEAEDLTNDPQIGSGEATVLPEPDMDVWMALEDKAALHEYADRFGVNLDKRKSLDNMREQFSDELAAR
jgi:hypothetical protein